MKFSPGNKIKVISGVFKGETGTIREIKNFFYYLDLDNRPKLREIGWAENEIELL